MKKRLKKKPNYDNECLWTFIAMIWLAAAAFAGPSVISAIEQWATAPKTDVAAVELHAPAPVTKRRRRSSIETDKLNRQMLDEHRGPL